MWITSPGSSIAYCDIARRIVVYSCIIVLFCVCVCLYNSNRHSFCFSYIEIFVLCGEETNTDFTRDCYCCQRVCACVRCLISVCVRFVWVIIVGASPIITILPPSLLDMVYLLCCVSCVSAFHMCTFVQCLCVCA